MCSLCDSWGPICVILMQAFSQLQTIVMPYLVAAFCLNEWGWDLLKIWVDFIKRWYICLKKQPKKKKSYILPFSIALRIEEKTARYKERAENPVECLAIPQLVGTYAATAPSLLVGGFPIWEVGDHLWAEQVNWKGGDRSRTQGEVQDRPPCSSFAGGLRVSTPQVSWETLKDTFSLVVDGAAKNTRVISIYIGFFSRFCLAVARDPE